jgi:hypothetical protein
MTIGEGISAAIRHLGTILIWAVIAATVGLILKMIEDRAGFLGQVAAAIIGGAWSLVTMFVVPVFVFEDKGVFSAVKESWAIIKKTWGESIVGNISIFLVFAAIGLAGFLIVIGALFSGIGTLFLGALAFFIILIAVLAIVASAMQGIFVVALYTYAKTGEIPEVFDRDMITGASLQGVTPVPAGKYLNPLNLFSLKNRIRKYNSTHPSDSGDVLNETGELSGHLTGYFPYSFTGNPNRHQ